MSFIASYIALWLLVTFLSLVAIGLLREVTVLRRSFVQTGFQGDSPLEIGSRAPHFSRLEVRTGQKTTSDIFHGRLNLIVFVTPQCSICRRLVGALRALSGRRLFSIVTVCRGRLEDCRGLGETLPAEVPLLFDENGDLSELYGVSGYPVSVVVDGDRRVRGYAYPREPRDLDDFMASAARRMAVAPDYSPEQRHDSAMVGSLPSERVG